MHYTFSCILLEGLPATDEVTKETPVRESLSKSLKTTICA
ncbi:MAG: hypothetical protein JWL82_404 [Parcubacteria group bacterium]|nr:hypothetical protein [Parcubacteria group bacterium]